MGFWESVGGLHYLLSPLAGIYAVGWWTYEGLYRVGIRKAASPHRPIICVGNLQVGGMSKTPLTIAIAQCLLSHGREVVVGASGYGSPHAADAAIAPEGYLLASEWGDEPALIRDALPSVPLVVGRNRVMAARLVHEAFARSVLVMDDGFQHLPLRKDVSIVIEPEGRRNPFCFPIGPCREPRTGLSRADWRIKNVSSVVKFEAKLEPECELEGRQIQLLSSIAKPERFADTVRTLIPTAQIVKHDKRHDHDPLTIGNLFVSFDRSLPILVTGKDWVKLRERSDLEGWMIVVVRQKVSISDPAFEAFLLRKIDEIAPQAT